LYDYRYGGTKTIVRVLTILHKNNNTMSKAEFINVNISEWDNSKVTIVPKGEGLNLLYEGKVPITKYVGTTAKTAYMLTSKDGLKRTTAYDSSTRKYTEAWDGAWTVSGRITDNISKIRPPPEGEEDKRTEDEKLRWKIIDRKEYIANLVRDATSEKVSDPISYKGVYVQPKIGKRKKTGNDPEGYAFLPIKVSYKYDEGCEMTTDNRGKPVPVFSARTPKGKYVDMARARAERTVKDPEKDAAVPMKMIPRVTTSINRGPDSWNIAEYLLELQYEQDDSLAGGHNDAEDTEALLNSEKDLEDEIPDL
jgi:hypothetical protein